MTKRWLKIAVLATTLTGCGVAPQALQDELPSNLTAQSLAQGRKFGFKLGAGRRMGRFNALASSGTLPSSVDLRAQCSPISDQGNLGSCTAFAMGRGLREFLELKVQRARLGNQLIPSLLTGNSSFVQTSPLYLYYKERQLEGTVNEDSGATMTDGMTVLAQNGDAPETDDPYVVSNFKVAPSAKAEKDAATLKIKEKIALNTMNDMKATVAQGYPVVFGFQVFESFEFIGNDGIMPMPTASESVIGGHAVMMVGYDDAKKQLIMRNSWGRDWGDNGYFYMPYAFVTPDNVQDVWTAK